MILGIDEVGRGPWAGPLVLGAVVLGGEVIGGLTDSKKLTKKRREELDVIIREQAAGYGLGWVSAQEIDNIGLSAALALACQRAVEAVDTLGIAYHEIVIDGTVNFLTGTPKGKYVTTMKKADLLVPSVSAASIIAKVARDKYMAEQDRVYDGYKFASHVGYGTAVHRAAIEKYGVTPLHRLSIAPLIKYKSPTAPLPSSQISSKSARRSLVSSLVGWSAPSFAKSKILSKAGATPPTATRADDITIPPPSNYMGAPAETEAANHLVRQGHEIVDRNWKTKYCEIDIVSTKGDTVYFTEVKYRKTPWQGDGLAAITPKKLNQMRFAAGLYAQTRRLDDINMQLTAISLTGDPPEVQSFILIDS